ncbi:MAG TPA: hypothetical protein VH478_03125 [Trebonia sp.]|jgi:hypothetical protein|nr:hypothetical protein [Trebonia sp.]
MPEFTYVSRSKVDVLEADLSRWRSPQVTATVSVPGVQLGVAPPADAPDLYRRANALIKKMERRGRMVPQPESGDLDVTAFYRDQSAWAQGLYSFKGDFSLDGDDARVVTYLLWRRWQDAIIVLVGSPQNVLGERLEHGGVWSYGTTGSWTTLLHFAESVLRTDEATLVGVAPAARRPAPGALPSGTLPSGTLPSGAPRSGALPWVEPEEIKGEAAEQPLPGELLDAPRALALAGLCLGPLSRLPVSHCDTAFRLFQRLPLTLRGTVPGWVTELLAQGGGGRARLDLLRQCRMVYVGSPLYTAR